MGNYANVVIAMLQKLELLTEDEAKKLAEEFSTIMMPDNYTQALDKVEKIFAKHEIAPVKAKLS